MPVILSYMNDDSSAATARDALLAAARSSDRLRLRARWAMQWAGSCEIPCFAEQGILAGLQGSESRLEGMPRRAEPAGQERRPGLILRFR